MVQFRKSKRFGPFRFTLSRRGFGASVGGGPISLSLGADGKVRRTFRVPGLSVWDTKVVGDRTDRRSGPPESETSAPPVQGVARYQSIDLPHPVSAKGHMGSVAFDGTWILLNHHGPRAKVNGLVDQRVNVNDLTGLMWRPPTFFVNGSLTFVLDSADLSADPMPNPRAVIVTRSQSRRFVNLIQVFEAAKL